MFHNVFVSFFSVTTRGVKLKISKVIISGKRLWDMIIIDFPIPSLKILFMLKSVVFTDELEDWKTRNSLKFQRLLKISITSPNSLTHISSYICHDLYFSDFTAAQLKLVSLIRSTKLPVSLHSCWRCPRLYRLSSLTQPFFTSCHHLSL